MNLKNKENYSVHSGFLMCSDLSRYLHSKLCLMAVPFEFFFKIFTVTSISEYSIIP